MAHQQHKKTIELSDCIWPPGVLIVRYLYCLHFMDFRLSLWFDTILHSWPSFLLIFFGLSWCSFVLYICLLGKYFLLLRYTKFQWYSYICAVLQHICIRWVGGHLAMHLDRTEAKYSVHSFFILFYFFIPIQFLISIQHGFSCAFPLKYHTAAVGFLLYL